MSSMLKACRHARRLDTAAAAAKQSSTALCVQVEVLKLTDALSVALQQRQEQAQHVQTQDKLLKSCTAELAACRSTADCPWTLTCVAMAAQVDARQWVFTLKQLCWRTHKLGRAVERLETAITSSLKSQTAVSG